MTEDTLVALCTPQGKGALSVLRLSGPKALQIGRSVASFLPEKPESHRLYFGTLKHKGRKLDEVLLSYFKKGSSFTGEETLEISCHGGMVYLDILESLIEEGARPAKKGEFSLQAFSNGKMDLTQAEGLLQLIESENLLARTESLKQLKGELSKRLLKIEEKWLFLLSHIEADIDFSLENLNTLNEDQIQEKIQELLQELESLLSSYQPFDRLQKGLLFGIFGSVNAGKSSLFNALLDQEKAIVSEEEGTTRDIVEAQIQNPKGLNILLKDCAGFRESESEGEKKGQKKSLELFKDSDYRLILIDISNLVSRWKEKTLPEELGDLELKKAQKQEALKEEDVQQLLGEDLSVAFKKLSPLQKNWLVFTKTDLLAEAKRKEKTNPEDNRAHSLEFNKDSFKSLFKNLKPEEIFFVSSLTKEGLFQLKEKMLACGSRNQESFLVTNSRHHEALNKMKKLLLKCRTKKSTQALQEETQEENQELREENLSLDIMALNLQEGLSVLYEILGKQLDDKILDQIFKKFCIGK